MARTKNLTKLVEDSRAALQDLSQQADTVEDHAPHVQPWLAGSILFSVAVEWETLSSSWMIAALNNNPAGLRRHVNSRITQAVSMAFPALAASPHLEVRLHESQSFSVELVTAMFDADGRNRGFWSLQHTKAQSDLLPEAARQALGSMNRNDWRVLEVLRSSRNVLAHRSAAATRELNSALRHCAHSDSSNLRRLSPSARSVNAATLGIFLKARPRGAKGSRLQILLNSVDRAMVRLIPVNAKRS